MNPTEIEMQLSELVNRPFDQAAFPIDFIKTFDPPKATLTKIRNAQSKANDEVFWPRKLHFRAAPQGQAAHVLETLKQQKFPKNKTPRIIVSTDGAELSAFDTKADESLHCDLVNLNNHFDFFLPLAGIDQYKAIEENAADVKAAGRLAKFHDEIVHHNPSWHTPEKRHALNQFITRILFCLFSEDTGSFEANLFVKTITEFGGDDGEHLQSLLKRVFDVMNVPESRRALKTPAYINAFPYVNGGLFAEKTEIPAFSKRAKTLLIEAANLNWREITPDIFGSMIQAVVDDDMRGDLGMHYTSVPNIMKVLHPLFLMSLEEEFANACDHRQERAMLKTLCTRLSKIRVFDPACGSGNFLIVAYCELRKLEMRIFQRQDELQEGQAAHPWESGVKLSNFYGIELTDFAAETAKLSLWIAEYQMNQKFKSLFGESAPDFPLKEGGHITHSNALRLDWSEVCPPSDDRGVETYVVGNPPYLGRAQQTKEHKADIAYVFRECKTNFKKLDLIASWVMLGADYCSRANAQCAFVATNSICQGEQIALLWPLVFGKGIEIGFAHKSFKWANNASRNAAVVCVILGIRRINNIDKHLYDSGTFRSVKNINPYLLAADNCLVRPISNAKTDKPVMKFGNMAADGGNLILSQNEKDQLVDKYPDAEGLIRRFVGSQELIKGISRWCLWIEEKDLDKAMSIREIYERILLTKKARENSKDSGTRSLAEKPHQFREMHVAKEHAVVIPRVSSENRQFIPIGLVREGAIISDSAFAVYDAEPYMFSIIASSMHVTWIKAVCGKLRTDYRYSNTLGYNTFPIPSLTKEQKEALEAHAWKIIAAREAHPGKTLAWLYDPKTMPDNLLSAHKVLDVTLEKIYIGRPFKDDTERLEHLFKRYAEMTAPQNEKLKKVA